MSFDSLVNKGDYFSAHYLAEVLPKDLKKKDGLFARWTVEEKDGRTTPRRGLRALGKPYFNDRPFFADFDARLRADDPLDPDDVTEWRKALNELHGTVLRALGYDPQPRELVIERAGSDHPVQVAYADRHLIAIECGWADDVDAALDDEEAGLLLHPVDDGTPHGITSGTKLATWLFSTDEPPRYVLILAGGVVVLADRATWGEGRYLAANLDIALGRNNATELDTIAALFGADSLLPPEEGGAEPLTELLTNSRNHAVGVSKELRDGLKESVELIANEVLARIRAQDARPEDIMEPGLLAKELGREALRYLYRILFLLYAEARPELGILPTNDKDYIQGYSIARLGDLVVRDIVGEEARGGFHLYESLDLLFRMVNRGHRPLTDDDASGREGLRFEPLRSDLFEPEAIQLIGRAALTMPGYDEDDPTAPTIDTRLRNETLHKVLRKLMLAKGRKKERGGFISYAQLGINQLGAVYEGLMSYTGFISTEELYEVAKNGDPKDGSWMIPASKVDDYPSEVFVRATDEDGVKTNEFVRYPEGSFVYRLAGRDRETSASYYTPESLTQVTVQLALQHRLDQDGTITTAREILNWKICEPALGSGAFLNEAINQIAAEYLKRRQEELKGIADPIAPERYEEELQKAKAYIALHNAYGVDLNDTAIELAEVSIWLNVMHPGLQAPWFGLHLRRGNSLIGAGRRVYDARQLTKGDWLKAAPEDVPFSAGAIPAGKVHHFLLPAEGWGAVAGAKEAKELAPDEAKRLAAWHRKMRARISDKKTRASQLQRLQALSHRAEYLWDLVIQRLTISEREISRKIDVWGADWIDQPANAVPKEKVYGDLTAPGTPYWRLKKVMDAWCALWFWPLDRVGLLDGTDEIYVPPTPPRQPAISSDESTEAASAGTGFGTVYTTHSLFDTGEPAQLDLDRAFDELRSAATATAGNRRTQPTRKRPSLDSVRPIIPLANLDDWLDFAEATLGRIDIPEGSLGAEFASLAALAEHEDQLQAWMGMDSAMKLPERFPWLDTVDNLVEQHGFFHWDLQFCHIFSRGGFDLQVGNPPWVRPIWRENVILAEWEPWFALTKKPPVSEWKLRRAAILSLSRTQGEFLHELASSRAAADYLSSPLAYSLLVGTQPDFYRAFMCRTWATTSRAGVVGLIHPDTHLSGAREGRLRAAAYRRLTFHVHFVNFRNLFEANPHTEFGIHIYARSGQIDFKHMGWIFDPSIIGASLAHDGSGPLPGLKHDHSWDIRPHRARIIHINESLLKSWRNLQGISGGPIDEVSLFYPVTEKEQGAIDTLGRFSTRLSQLAPYVSAGYHEKAAKESGLIRYEVDRPNSLSELILQGTHFGIATPFSKEPNEPFRSGKDWVSWNLEKLPVEPIPRATYARNCDKMEYDAAQDNWRGVSYARWYRVAWRRMIDSKSSERSLFAALIPPGPTHVHTVQTLALDDNRSTALIAGFWATLPLDYVLRITGRSDLQTGNALNMIAPDGDHPLASPLLLRILRLNCLTNAYAALWREVVDPAWTGEQWAASWPGLNPIGDQNVLRAEWTHLLPLRTDRERRAALVELDSLVAVWLGISADELVAIYKARYPILSDREAEMWFDSTGRCIAADPFAFGYGQTKEHFHQLMAYLDPEVSGPVPVGYTAPFYKADREAEYRQAHAVFSERLRKAQSGQGDER